MFFFSRHCYVRVSKKLLICDSLCCVRRVFRVTICCLIGLSISPCFALNGYTEFIRPDGHRIVTGAPRRITRFEPISNNACARSLKYLRWLIRYFERFYQIQFSSCPELINKRKTHGLKSPSPKASTMTLLIWN